MTNTLLEKVFKIEDRKSSIKTEVIGGVTTFLAMAYIIFVNPAILSLAGMDKGALMTVTCLATAIGTFLAAFIGNVPIAMAPGMGLNAFFTFTLAWRSRKITTSLYRKNFEELSQCVKTSQINRLSERCFIQSSAWFSFRSRRAV